MILVLFLLLDLLACGMALPRKHHHRQPPPKSSPKPKHQVPLYGESVNYEQNGPCAITSTTFTIDMGGSDTTWFYVSEAVLMHFELDLMLF